MMNIKKPTDTLMASEGLSSNGEQGVEGHVTRMTPVLPRKPTDAGYDWMGPSLRRMYDDVLNEPVPDSFVDLLKQLHDRQKK